MTRRRMEKPPSYSRCFLILACIGVWWLFFAFHFSVFTRDQDSTNSVEDSNRVQDPLPLEENRKVFTTKTTHVPVQVSQKVRQQANLTLQPFWRALASIKNRSDPCGGRYVYMHDLPSEFNQQLLDGCRNLSPWVNMCKYTENCGLGPPMENAQKILPGNGWYATNQFAVDVIFHSRMKQYECLTNDSSKAATLFVPFYAGLDIARHLWGANVTMRDSLPLRLGRWLRERPEWRVMGGRDHFMVGGRVTWDFRRLTDEQSDWGNRLLYIPEVMNMSMLMVEASPYHKNDFGIPYPTYFHPSQDSDIVNWQERVRQANRSALFSFAGAPRLELSTSIRGQIMDQCKESQLCNLLECDRGESKCHVPSVVMKLFQESVFCMQPQGDSYTRRSIFDSMISGCIPVFFHEHSAYTQYVWHLPGNRSKYSVYIPEDDIRSGAIKVEDVLLKFSHAEVVKMREEVIRLIPGLVYADPRHRLSKFKDSFDLTVQALVEKVTDLRILITEGKDDFVPPSEEVRNSDLILSQRNAQHSEVKRHNVKVDTMSRGEDASEDTQ